MSEETVNSVVEETVETQPEKQETQVESQSNQETQENKETQNQETKKDEGFKPWKRSPEGTHIPYDRFKQVNDERKAYAAELEASKAKIAEYEAAQKKLEEIKDPDDINPADYADAKEYLKAYSAAVKANAIKETKNTIEAEMQQRQSQAHLQAVQSSYMEKYNKAAKEEPEVAQANDYLGQYADRLHPAILQELMSDDNSPHLVHAIVTNEKALRQLFEGNPIQTLKMIGKLSGLVEEQRSTKTTSTKAEDTGNVEDIVAAAKSALKDSIPRSIKSNSPGRKSIADMSQSEYEAYMNRKEGRIRKQR